MKQLYIPCLLILFVLLNCDGRKSQKEALRQSIVEFKQEHVIVKNNYIPDSYHEVITDSSMTNGFKTQVKLFTKMDENVIRTVKKDEIINQFNYRCINGVVKAWFKEDLVFNEIIDTAFLIQQLGIPGTDLENYNLSGIWIDQNKSLVEGQLIIDIQYLHIVHNSRRDYKLLINRKGNFYITHT